MEKPAYYGVQAISNSALSFINPEEKGCPEKFFGFLEGKETTEETSSMLTGTLVHAFILEPESINVINAPKISDTVKSIVDIIFARHGEVSSTTTLYAFEEEILDLCKEMNYGQSWKKETILKKVIEEGGETYFELLVENKDKLVVLNDVFAALTKIVSAIKSNKVSNRLLIDGNEEEMEYLNEFEIYWEYTLKNGKALKCKSKIDRLVIDHKNKTFQIIDLKTTSESVEKFPDLFEFRRIYRQLAFYELAVKSYLKDQDYTPINHFVVAAESVGYNRVRNFCISPNFINKGLGEIHSLMERISWHIETNERINSMEDVYSDFSFYIDL